MPTEPEQMLRRIALAAVAAYDLPQPLSMRPIEDLVNNAVFEVTGKGVHLALRIHRPGYRSSGQIRAELAFLQLAAGELFVGVGGEDDPALPERYCDLFTWIDGRELRHGTGLGRRSAFVLGEGLGRLHNAAERIDAAGLPGLQQWDADAMFTDASPIQPGLEDFLPAQAWTLFQKVADQARAVFDELGRGRAQWGLIHHDYILGNCLFKQTADGWRLGILDFDDLGFGYFLYDLAPLLGNLFDWPDAYGRLRRAFLNGYRNARPLLAELERHLPVLMAARHAAVFSQLAARQWRGETDLPFPMAELVEYRLTAMERCLSLTAS